MRKRPHTNSKMTRHQHEMRPAKTHTDPESGKVTVLARRKNPFGRGLNRKKTVLLVPELRKPRSQRDPELLRKQQKSYQPA